MAVVMALIVVVVNDGFDVDCGDNAQRRSQESSSSFEIYIGKHRGSIPLSQ